ncbi:MAG TPA: class I SAM-dependent methyltransferase [Candidatus Limnocylindrales bacterium]|nr:class I SAM-dependent methyltransferase [Candidatus Limnocylindrales bacterium]
MPERHGRPETASEALARLYDLDLSEDPGDLDLYLATAARTGGPIVELGVGSGRIAAPLAAAGHIVIGVDDDPAMLARAERRLAATKGARRLRLIRADMVEVRRTDLGTAAADGAGLVLIALNTILLAADRRRQRRLLATMAELLRPGGLVVVDAWLPSIDDLVRFDGRLSLEWLRRDPESGHEVTKLAAAWYDETSRVVTLTTIFDEGEPGTTPRRWTRSDALRLIGADELMAFAEEGGLVVEQLAGDHDLGPFGPGSERAILIARKPG